MTHLQEQTDHQWAEGFCDRHIPGPYAEAMEELLKRLVENRIIGIYGPPHRFVGQAELDHALQLASDGEFRAAYDALNGEDK